MYSFEFAREFRGGFKDPFLNGVESEVGARAFHHGTIFVGKAVVSVGGDVDTRIRR